MSFQVLGLYQLDHLSNIEYEILTRKVLLFLISILAQTKNQLFRLKKAFLDRYPDLLISMGDTPGCSVAEDFTGIDEIRPGNFVFYDLTQNRVGSNSIEQIAVAMACPVVAIHKDRREIIVYGGGVHFSKDRLENEDACQS